MKKLMSILVVSAMLLQAVVAVAGAAAAAQTNEGKTLTIAMQQDMPNFNYWDLASNSVWKKYAFGGFVYEGLTLLDPSGALFPCLAKSWTFDEPTLTVTVNMRQGVKFHDGTTMTVDDIVSSYKGFRDGCTYSGQIIDAFDSDGDGKCSAAEIAAGVIPVNDTVVKFVMAKRYGQFFLQTLGVPIVPKAIWQSHLTAEGTFDTLWNTDDKATIGTAAYYYSAGEKNVFRELKRFDDYWGKDFKTPGGYSMYPVNINRIYFKIYASLDTAILALKSGQVDHIPWTVTPGYVSDLIANPKTAVMSISDNGYFYLAFNMKREPMNYLAFRQAVSYVIDKETITQRYMGGFGQPGDSSEPPFWTDWYNSSVETYPFNLDSARSKLTSAGFTGVGTALKMPDGRPVPPLILMTPPADYDPVRIKAGELIAKNLRSLGIDVIAKPVDFDTLVAKMNAFDYDMLIIGWSLSQDPVGNVFDILGPQASQNYFGFWNPSTCDNPWYNKLGGLSTKADAPTQALATQVFNLQQTAKQTFDRDTQIKYTKWAQGLLAQALPCNVIYYRVNNYAVAKAWTGWTPFLGEVFHIFSLGRLEVGAGPAPGEQVTSILNVPDKLPYNVATDAWVLAIDSNGLPIKNSTVTLTGTGVTFSTATGKTDELGVLKFKVTGTTDGYVTVTAKAESGTNSYTTSKIVNVQRAISPALYIEASPAKLFLNPGESSAVTFKVTDQAKAPVSGVQLALDEGLLGYGSVDSATKTTGTDGTAVITYTAPSALPNNKHLEVRMSVTANPTTVYKTNMINTITQFIVVKNTAPSDWHFVSIYNIDHYSCNATNDTANVTLRTFDDENAVIPNEVLTVSFTNPDMIDTPVTTVTTDATGFTNLTVKWKAGIDTNATQVFVKSRNFPNAAGAGACLLFKGATVPTEPLYGGMSFVSAAPIIDPNSGISLPFTVMLWDLDGNLPQGDVPVALIVGEPSDGSTAALKDAPDYIYTSIADYAAIQVGTTKDNAVMTSGGYFLSTLMTDAEIDTLNAGSYTTWDGLAGDGWTGVDVAAMKPYTITNGIANINITVDSLVLADNVPHLLVAPMAKMGFYVTPDGNNYWWQLQGTTSFKTELVMKRSMKITSPKYSFPDGVMRDYAPGNVSTGEVTVYDQDNNVVAGVGISPTVSVRSPVFPYFKVTVPSGTVTDASGKASFSVKANTKDTKSNWLTNPAKQPLYMESKAGDSYNVFVGIEIFDTPVQLYLGMEVTPVISSYKETATAKAHLYDETGASVANTDITFDVAAGNLSAKTGKTDANGNTSVTYTPLALEKGKFFSIAEIKTQALVEGYGPVTSAFSIVAYTIAPAMTELSPAPGYKTTNTTVTFTGKISATAGVDKVNYTLDTNTTAVPVTVGTDGAFSISLSNLAVGTHTVKVNMVDKLGNPSTKTFTFTVDKTVVPEEEEGFPMMYVIIIVIVIVLIIIVAAVMMMGGKKPEEKTEEPKAGGGS